MSVRYSKPALKQVEAALSYIWNHSPAGADNLQRRLIKIVAMLEKRPYAGRPTSKIGVRRVSLKPYPYTLDYRIKQDEIVLLRFRHTSRRPLP